MLKLIPTFEETLKLIIMNFNLKRFLRVMFYSNLSIYLIWSFIELSFAQPILRTFCDNESRSLYVAFLFVVSFFSIPYYCPDKEN